MAFVCKSERALNFQPTDVPAALLEKRMNPNLGPGVYLGHKDFSPTKPAQAPFQSSKVREVSEVTNFNPGMVCSLLS